MDDRVDWVRGLGRTGGSPAVGPRDMLGSWRAATAALHLPRGDGPARFGSPEQAEFPRGARSSDRLGERRPGDGAVHGGLRRFSMRGPVGRTRTVLWARDAGCRLAWVV